MLLSLLLGCAANLLYFKVLAIRTRAVLLAAVQTGHHQHGYQFSGPNTFHVDSWPPLFLNPFLPGQGSVREESDAIHH